MEIRYYNINNLLSFSVRGGEKSKLDYIHRQYSYFRTEKPIKDVDIEIHVGGFDVDRVFGRSYEVVNRKYRIYKDAIYAEDSYKVAKFQFLIAGLHKERTKIYFDGNFWGYYILYKFFIEPVIRFKLNAKGYFMIHSSSVYVDGKAFVFPASPSVGKTSTMLNWLHGGMGFIADEYTILKDGKVYSYPTPLRLHDYNLKANPYLCGVMPLKDRIQIYIRTWILRLTLGYGDVTHEVDIWNCFKNVRIQDRADLGELVLFTKYAGRDVRVKKISKKHLIEKLLIIDKFETTRFNEYLDAYYYIHNVPKDQQFWNRMRNNLMAMFDDTSYLELNIPEVYSEKTFNQINQILGYRKAGNRYVKVRN